MHLWTVMLLLACATRPVAAQAVAPSHRAAIEELFAVIGAERELTAGAEAEVRAATARQPGLTEFEPLILAHTRRYLRWADVRDDFVRAYARTYTEAEVRQLAAFYRTPVGQKAIRSQGQLAAEARRITQARLAAHRQELSDAILARIRARGQAPQRRPGGGAGPIACRRTPRHPERSAAPAPPVLQHLARRDEPGCTPGTWTFGLPRPASSVAVRRRSPAADGEAAPSE